MCLEGDEDTTHNSTRKTCTQTRTQKALYASSYPRHVSNELDRLTVLTLDNTFQTWLVGFVVSGTVHYMRAPKNYFT